MTDYEHLRQLAENATPGPWHWTPYEDAVAGGDCGPSLWNESEDFVLGAWGHSWWGVTVEDQDAEFIAAANPDTILRLLDELANAKADALEEACEMFHPGAGYGGANVHQRLRTRARDYRGNR